MEVIRILFKKTGSAKYISHLDLNRCMGRILRKSRIPLWYTEGFHPHLFLTFALPLSLGMESLCETMDVRLVDESYTMDEVKARLSEAFPHDLHILDAYPAKMKHTEIAFARFSIDMQIGAEDAEALFKKIKNLLNSDKIIVKKKSKSGKLNELDLKEKLKDFKLKISQDVLNLQLTLPAGCAENINPAMLMEWLETELDEALEFSITRTRLLTKELEDFV
ncbi:MAG: TIGR03936 family radical SAM-associated protein [Oscillospiraceae bacterium]|jgi:radical SAM-linked protein|nr:TIGR03936 family radical SAM-associated protein [Oscillospiraceae bacterium]